MNGQAGNLHERESVGRYRVGVVDRIPSIEVVLRPESLVDPKLDANGTLTCTLPDAGWWCITAYRDGGKAKRDGKEYPLQLRTTLWVHVDPKP